MTLRLYQDLEPRVQKNNRYRVFIVRWKKEQAPILDELSDILYEILLS